MGKMIDNQIYTGKPQKWEYYTTNINPGDRILNEMGSEGWELITVMNNVWYFKRRV